MFNGAWSAMADLPVLLDRTYRRDSEGRFATGGGGSRGIRQELSEAQTLPAIGLALNGEYRRITGRDIDSIHLDGLDPDVARVHAEGILRGAEMFPAAVLHEVASYGDGGHVPAGRMPAGCVAVTQAASRIGSGIYLNTHWTAQKLRDSQANDDSIGHMAGAHGDLTRTGSHEMGHVAAHTAGSDRVHATIEQKLASMAAGAGQATSVFVRRHISTYGATNAHEAAGEATADVASRREGASDVSKSVVAELRAALADKDNG